ncbi:unnamed protein product [Larinioides sclopetarius]|uniref:Secreted protein n=1 Tax=Larinioides sclopetarius TaxID=280406 RepID=A0AAV2BMI4_9ARAC
MFIFVISFLGLLYSASCTEGGCLYEAQSFCHFETLKNLQIPSTEEELQNSCTNLTQMKECIKNSVSNCNVERAQRYSHLVSIRQSVKEAQNLLNVTTEICQEDSELHDNFVLDMRCYREVFDTDKEENLCMRYTDNVDNYIRSRLRSMLQGRADERQPFNTCLSTAKDTAIKIIGIVGNLEDHCPVTMRIDILELLDDLKLVTRKDMPVRQFLESDSFFE